MKPHWTAAHTTECFCVPTETNYHAAYFLLSVWGVAHVPFQKQRRDCAASGDYWSLA